MARRSPSRHHDCSRAADAEDPKTGVRHDDVSPATSLEGTDPLVPEHRGGRRGRGPDGVHEWHTTSDRGPHDVEQVRRATRDRPTVRQSSHTVGHRDVLRPEPVGTVRHAGRRHRVRHQRDVLRTDEAEDALHQLRRQVRPVSDELDHGLSASRRREEHRDRPRGTM